MQLPGAQMATTLQPGQFHDGLDQIGLRAHHEQTGLHALHELQQLLHDLQEGQDAQFEGGARRA